MNEQIPPLEGSQPISDGPEQQPATASPEPVEPEKLPFLKNLKQQYATYETGMMKKLNSWESSKLRKDVAIQPFAGVGMLILGVVVSELMKDGINPPLEYWGKFMAVGGLAPMLKTLVDINIFRKFENMKYSKSESQNAG